MKRSTLLAPVVSLGLVLAACGGDDAAIDPPTEQTSDTAAPSEGSELRAPTPIAAATSGSPGQSSGADSATELSAASDVPEGEMRIAPFVAGYVLADDFPALPTDNTGYVFAASAVVTAEQVVAIAAAFGLDGEPVRTDDGTWRLGPDDGTAPIVWVYGDAQQSWSYNSAWADDFVVDRCTVSVDSDGEEVTDCPEPEPPTGVPTADEAEQRTRDMLGTLGVDVTALGFETYADEWSASITVNDGAGTATTRYWNFNYGGDGVLQYAGGSLATPEPVGPYDLVDLDTAFARLQEQAGMNMPMPLLDGPAVADDAVTSGPAPDDAGDEGADEPPLDTIEVSEPLPVDESLDREAITVTLVDVEADVWWVWDTDGTLWLVPAYRFIDTDGGWHTVPAVTDEFLIQAGPPVESPLPVEPDGGIGDGAEPLPAPEESLPPVPTETIEDPVDALSTLDELVGLSIEEFTAEAERLGYVTRVVQQDSESLAVTLDFSESRVNVAVEGPRVVSIESIG